MSDSSVVVAPRFCGPPTSGNGGYVCGQLASFVKADAVAVRLRVPPPLEKTLDVRLTEAGASLLDGDILVAEARETTVVVDTPEPPEFEEARVASRRYRGFDQHWYPTCFVCGPQRDADDGLCIFPGPLEGRNIVAAPWIPHSSLASADDVVDSVFLWSALDCPGGFTFDPGDGAVLLGELQVALYGDVSVGEHCVLAAWEIGREGRKHFTATALYGESGSCRGVSLGTWFEVPLSATSG
jgi:hypothetical protein